MDPDSQRLLRFHCLTQHMTVPEIKVSDNRYALVYLRMHSAVDKIL